jgi:8-oxo-dGTP pyrophosphatase MutT (NUDIX family)
MSKISRRAGIIALSKDEDSPDYKVGILKALSREREWVLPKGHIEEGETFSETALREAREELGVRGVLTSSPSFTHSFPIHSSNGFEGEIYVTFYVMIVTGSCDSEEAKRREARFVPMKEALSLLKYPDHREIIREVEEMWG